MNLEQDNPKLKILLVILLAIFVVVFALILYLTNKKKNAENVSVPPVSKSEETVKPLESAQIQKALEKTTDGTTVDSSDNAKKLTPEQINSALQKKTPTAQPASALTPDQVRAALLKK